MYKSCDFKTPETCKRPVKTVKPLTRTRKSPTRKMWGTGFRGTGMGWPGIPQGYPWYSLTTVVLHKHYGDKERVYGLYGLYGPLWCLCSPTVDTHRRSRICWCSSKFLLLELKLYNLKMTIAEYQYFSLFYFLLLVFSSFHSKNTQQNDQKTSETNKIRKLESKDFVAFRILIKYSVYLLSKISHFCHINDAKCDLRYYLPLP